MNCKAIKVSLILSFVINLVLLLAWAYEFDQANKYRTVVVLNEKIISIYQKMDLISKDTVYNLASQLREAKQECSAKFNSAKEI